MANTPGKDLDKQANELAHTFEVLASVLRNDKFRNAAYKLEDERERAEAAKSPAKYFERHGVDLPKEMGISIIKQPVAPDFVYITVCLDVIVWRVCISVTPQGWRGSISRL